MKNDQIRGDDMSESEKQLREARENLLDLTLRNPLINFRPTARRTIQVIDEIPKEVFDRLVLQERTMQFKPLPANQADDGKTSQTLAANQMDDGELSDESVDNDKTSQLIDVAVTTFRMQGTLSVDNGKTSQTLAANHTDRYLQTELEKEALG